MLTPERHRAILRLLSKQGRVTMAEIAERFEISAATARRDAVLLAETGVAARSHGGLLPANFFQEQPNLRAGPARQTSIKARIARRALNLLPHEGNVFVDAGATCLEVGRMLTERPDLRIFTNSIPLIALASQSQAVLTAIGGEVQKGSLALTGSLAQSWLNQLRFDCAVIGASSLDLADGVGTGDLPQAVLKAEVLNRASFRMLVADAEKWNRSAAVRFARWSMFTAFVTNNEPPRGGRAVLAAARVKLSLA